jgi:beta-glucosidase
VESSVERPVKELKKFRKILLSPGENQQVRFSLSKEDLSFWDVNEKVWKAETGEFIISIGTSSRDIRQKISFNLIED